MATSTTTHFPHLQAERRRTREKEVDAFITFNGAQATCDAAIAAARAIYDAAVAAAKRSIQESERTYTAAVTARKAAEKALDDARAGAGGRKPVYYQLTDAIGPYGDHTAAVTKAIAEKTYTLRVPQEDIGYAQPTSALLAALNDQGILSQMLPEHIKNINCVNATWEKRRAIRQGDVLFLVTSSSASNWVPDKVYKGVVRSGPIYNYELHHAVYYHQTYSLTMTWEVGWREVDTWGPRWQEYLLNMDIYAKGAGWRDDACVRRLPGPGPGPVGPAAPTGPLPTADTE